MSIDILVILPVERDREALEIKHDLDAKFHYLVDEEFKYDAICTGFDVSAYVERAIAYVREHNIDGVIYSHDMASLIAAIVCERIGLAGPSVESVFLACHKYYSRQKEPSPVPCQALNLSEYSLEGIKYPCYVKAPSLMCSHLQFIVNDEEEMKKILIIMREEMPKWGRCFLTFLNSLIQRKNIHMLTNRLFLLKS